MKDPKFKYLITFANIFDFAHFMKNKSRFFVKNCNFEIIKYSSTHCEILMSKYNFFQSDFKVEFPTAKVVLKRKTKAGAKYTNL